MTDSCYPTLPPIDFEGNQPAELGPCSRAAYLASNWIIAVDSWDYCDPKPLGLMIQKHAVPEELRHVISDIIVGKRKQNKKAAAKLKSPAAHRLLSAGIYRGLKHDVIDATLQRKTLHDYHDKADDMGIEVIELRKIYLSESKKFQEKWATNMGMGVEAFQDLVSYLDDKIKNYPNI
ncbi:hypothetical protein CN03_01370 [Thalassolituus oleivorans]|uniref:hypothetical protein n=1 Tax=Thalassolituus oleivorans TaxID=187493 RepID=UPI0009492964|nr:hypothetical protein [Thalassolituus oleivorans]APR65684.1 hypothetical protein CN03_01370 [Thalassolituus oleivorans]